MRTSTWKRHRWVIPLLVFGSLLLFRPLLNWRPLHACSMKSASNTLPGQAHESDAGRLIYADLQVDQTPLDDLPNARPVKEDRKFKLDIIEAYIAKYANKIADPALRQIFKNAWPNTVDTTIAWHDPDPDRKGYSEWLPRTFVTTGDIQAMWLRDSAAQVHPYLPLLIALNDTKKASARVTEDSEALYTMILGVLYQQCQGILHHPWSNAFRPPYDALHHVKAQSRPQRAPDRVRPLIPEDQSKKPPGYDPPRQWIEGDGGITVWESKYELDSLAYFLKLAADIAQHSGRTEFVYNTSWRAALKNVLSTLQSQQRSTQEDSVLDRLSGGLPKSWNEAWDRQWGVQAGGQYMFQRTDVSPTESRALGGRGEPARRIGLVKSAFRPSDDATLLPFLIPSNAMLAVNLERVARLLPRGDAILSDKMTTLAAEIRSAIGKYAFIERQGGRAVYAYEVDGFGASYFMDDANVPSLLSLPYLGFLDRQDASYVATRRLLLSQEANKYYFQGKAGRGIGGPHIGLGYVWPMAIIMQAMTSDDDDEIKYCLRLLRRTTAGTGLIHESFHVDVVKGAKFTRAWFSWANGLYGELMVKLVDSKPHLLSQEYS